MGEFISCEITTAVGRNETNNRLGGIDKLYLFAYEKYSKSLNLVSGQEVVTFPETTAYQYDGENMSFTESTSLKDGGVVWTQKLNFTITKSSSNSEVFKLVRQDYSAIILDRNGDYRFIGMRNGGEVSVNATSGTNKNEMNGYSISLEAKEDNQAYYIPDFEAIFNVSIPYVPVNIIGATDLVYENFYGGSSVDLSWNVGIGGTYPIAGYRVYINDSLFTTQTGTTLSLSHLQAQTTYSIRVKTFDSIGCIARPTNRIFLTTYTAGFAFRVANDEGYIESLECVTVKGSNK
tara:strand:+ start:1149 stop:2021 length:873 start_codon:yes stop_codon:yes gene_type:complete